MSYTIEDFPRIRKADITIRAEEPPPKGVRVLLLIDAAYWGRDWIVGWYTGEYYETTREYRVTDNHVKGWQPLPPTE